VLYSFYGSRYLMPVLYLGASRGCHRDSPRRARSARTATFSGLPGGALVGWAAGRAWPLKSPTPRRANLLVDGYFSRTPGV
jgi:hypothetical protein